MALYKGWSSFEFQRIKTFSLTDIELVKMDLLQHIYTRKGERVMMPRFGTTIPELVFEPLDDELLEELEDELRTVFEYDPRVELMQLIINPLYDQNTVSVSATLKYIELNMTDEFTLHLEFKN